MKFSKLGLAARLMAGAETQTSTGGGATATTTQTTARLS